MGRAMSSNRGEAVIPVGAPAAGASSGRVGARANAGIRAHAGGGVHM